MKKGTIMRVSMRYIGFVAILILLAGCASKDVWHREGASEMDFKRDSYSCERDLPVIYCQGFGCIDATTRYEG